MKKIRSFRFGDERLNRRLMNLLKKSEIPHEIDREGVLHYSPESEEVIENELISKIRDEAFSSWQILCCPKVWIERYKRYMNRRGIPFKEEWIDRELCFLIARKYRPHSWKLDDESAQKQHRIAV